MPSKAKPVSVAVSGGDSQPSNRSSLAPSTFDLPLRITRARARQLAINPSESSTSKLGASTGSRAAEQLSSKISSSTDGSISNTKLFQPNRLKRLRSPSPAKVLPSNDSSIASTESSQANPSKRLRTAETSSIKGSLFNDNSIANTESSQPIKAKRLRTTKAPTRIPPPAFDVTPLREPSESNKPKLLVIFKVSSTKLLPWNNSSIANTESSQLDKPEPSRLIKPSSRVSEPEADPIPNAESSEFNKPKRPRIIKPSSRIPPPASDFLSNTGLAETNKPKRARAAISSASKPPPKRPRITAPPSSKPPPKRPRKTTPLSTKPPPPNVCSIVNGDNNSENEEGADGDDEEENGAVGNISMKRQLSRTDPPLSDLTEIFEDIVKKALSLGLDQVLKRNVTIKVATMCSGTESPLLALIAFRRALKKLANIDFNFDHLFSAEIEPYKQSYIERNFGSKIIFRDIRELTHGDRAFNAYGQLVDIPGGVDFLIAGFSCVDFSRLNSRGKNLSDPGESGDTFRAIVHYMVKYRPAIVILENVQGAPWDIIKAIIENDRTYLKNYFNKLHVDPSWAYVWDEDDNAYAANFLRVDTKDYYIPQTRSRGYMVCIDSKKDSDVSQKVEEWGSLMAKLRRRASSSVEAFLLHEEDPRLHRARDQLARRGREMRQTEWVLCEGRNQGYRDEKQLGPERPLTRWVNGGSSKAPDYWWLEWSGVQVERVWETMEICFLRNALGGFDPLYKPRVWDLSQNIDRFVDGAPPGIASCLTPAGISFLTIRGGPLLGLEALSLQGLPIDELLLSRETEKELLGLAGNAMTSTVVGASILAALIVGRTALQLENREFSHISREEVSKVKEMTEEALGSSKALQLMAEENASIKVLHATALASACLCHCEGQTTTTRNQVYRCLDCHHTACEKCKGVPEHSYGTADELPIQSRVHPSNFVKQIKANLPMRLVLVGLNIATFKLARTKVQKKLNENGWSLYIPAITPALEEELRFHRATRGIKWIVTYDATHSILQLVFSTDQICWQLYAKPERTLPVNSPLRVLLRQPIARMQVQGNELLSGNWKVSIPIDWKVELDIRGAGEQVKCWEASLGIFDPKVADKKVWSTLHISKKLGPARGSADDKSIDKIAGEYQFLPKCGTASGSLHKRVNSKSSRALEVFLFLDPGRTSLPHEDGFVFSRDNHRLKYEEVRDTIASMNLAWRPTDVFPQPPDVDSQLTDVPFCQFAMEEVECDARLQPFNQDVPFYKVPLGDISELVSQVFWNSTRASHTSSCNSAIFTVLSCEVPLKTLENTDWTQGAWFEVDKKNLRRTFAGFNWLLERARNLQNFSSEWRPLEMPVNIERCQTCAPKRPAVRWTFSTGRAPKAIPFDDPKQAGTFERAIKARTAPFVTHTRIDDQQRGCIKVGLNVVSLAHRAMNKLPSTEYLRLSWRFDAQYEWPAKIEFDTFTLKNNNDEEELVHKFVAKIRHPDGSFETPTTTKLRPEQARSLRWMVNQESGKIAPFIEQEIEETTLAELGWRAEARAETPTKARGGVLSDDVGFGKTLTILALIDIRMDDAKYVKDRQSHEDTASELISLHATLIIVPKTLLRQWSRQIEKFLGSKYKVLEIWDMLSWNTVTLKQFKSADIILVAWPVFSSPIMASKIALFAALPEGPAISHGRAFKTWLNQAIQRIQQNTKIFLNSTDLESFYNNLDKSIADMEADDELYRSVPTKRFRGAAYTEQTKKASKASTSKAAAKTTKPQAKRASTVFKLTKNGSHDQMKGPPLQMFRYNRIVIDEYTYVKEQDMTIVQSLKANYRWVLSGTPRLGDFTDLQLLASFLKVNLGVDSDAATLQSRQQRKFRQERTTGEEFDSFGQSFSPAWHQERHGHAQVFLDHFARKNVAQVGEIPIVESVYPITLSTMERISYLELAQQVGSQDVRQVRGGKSRSDGDRVRRINEVLRSSSSSEEALIKCGAFFTVKSLATSEDPTLTPLEYLIREREVQEQDLVKEITTHLRHAEWLYRQCGNPESEYSRWQSHVNEGCVLDPDTRGRLLGLISRAQEGYHESHEGEFYREPRSVAQAREDKARMRAWEKDQKEAKKGKKGKKVPAKKTKRSEKAKAGTDEDDASDGTSESISSKESQNDVDALEQPLPPFFDPRPDRIPCANREEKLKALRRLTGHLRRLGSDLSLRKGSLRFLESIKATIDWQAGTDGPLRCAGCNTTNDPNLTFILGLCGHIACSDCLRRRLRGETCVAAGCDSAAEGHHTHCVAEFADQGQPDVKFGSKTDAVLQWIMNTPEEDQVLLFVQFEDLMDQITTALHALGIKFHAIRNNKSMEAAENLDQFQEETRAGRRRKVILLNPSNESAAGANLTNANHVMFVAPLLTSSLADWVAAITQCIGRARRYGQKKIVFVYHFLVLDTIDVDIFQDRTGKRLVETSAGEWEMLAADQLSDDQKRVDRGTGFTKQHPSAG